MTARIEKKVIHRNLFLLMIEVRNIIGRVARTAGLDSINIGVSHAHFGISFSFSISSWTKTDFGVSPRKTSRISKADRGRVMV